MKKHLIITIIIITAFFSSCKTTNVVGNFSKIKQTLETNTWVLQDNNTSVKGFNGNDITLKFRQENGLNAIGFSGCNNYSGHVELTPETIAVTSLSSTKIACPETHSESSYLSLLRQANRYELTSSNKLSLFKDKILLLTYKTQ